MESGQKGYLSPQDQLQFQKFTEKLDALNTIIGEAIAYFHAWRGLMIDDQDTVDALNRYKGFFAPTRRALQLMSLLQFAKLFDKDKRTISIRSVLWEAQSNRGLLLPHIEEDVMAKIESQIAANATLLETLKAFRDQRLAHHDSSLIDRGSLEYGKVVQLIEDTKSVYNALRHGHEGAIRSFRQISEGAENHTEKVVRLVVEDRNRMRQRIDETMRNLSNPDRVESKR